MIKKRTVLPGFLITAMLVAMLWMPAVAGSIPTMTKETLKSMLDDPDVVVLDVRTGRDWKSSEFKIKGAVRANPGDFKTWVSKFDKGKQIVLYCA